jgi:hypothetical protein
MKKILEGVVLVAVAAMGFVVLDGCAAKKEVEAKPSADPIIQHYMQRRSDLIGQKRRLAATYGADSAEVAGVDRQIALVDEALAQWRTQLIEEERARQAVKQMKQEAAPMVEGSAPASTQPAPQPGAAERQ